MIVTSILTGSASAQDSIPEVARISAQDFNLFESVSTGSGADALQERPRGRRLGASRSSEPEFTLIGTSRIGNKYSVVLRNKDGSEVVVDSSTDTNTQIGGYSQFSIVNISSGNVAIQYPSGTSCVEFADKGVSCNSATNIASLELTNGAPLPRSSTRLSRFGNASDEEDREGDLANLIVNEESDGEVVVSTEDDEPPPNPFAALRARAQGNTSSNGTSQAQAITEESLQRRGFTPRRIDPADVPPGMRIVSTPFGDRLVEQ